MKTININKYPNLEKEWLRIADLSDVLTKDELVSSVVSAYKNVFNSSAWWEWVKCSSSCWYKETFEDAPEMCPNCWWKIEDYYSDLEVEIAIENISNEIRYKQALALFSDDGKVNGFTWGWNTNLEDLNKEKLGLSEKKLKELCNNLMKIWINPEERFYYQSETGITLEYRKKWLWKDLIYLNQDLLEENKDKVPQIIQRTSKLSPMSKIRKKQGYKQVFDYGDEDQRIIFAKLNN